MTGRGHDDAGRTDARARFGLALLLCTGLVACGGGGGDGGNVDGDDDGTGSVTSDGETPGTSTSGGGSVLADSEAPDVPLTDAGARALGVDVAELGDLLQFLAVVLPADVSAPGGPCEGGGTRTPSDESTGRRMTFADCALIANPAVRLDGSATLAREQADPERSRLGLEELTVRSGGRTVSSDGALRLTADGDARRISLARDAFLVDDSQGELTVSVLDATVPREEMSGEATFDYVVSSSRAGETVAVSTEGPLEFDGTVGCPTSGALVLTFEDDRTLRLDGAAGGNVALAGDFGDDTIACTEIGRLVPPTSGFTPPPVPGN